MTRPSGYGCSASAMISSLTNGPYESAVSMKSTPCCTAARTTRTAPSWSAGSPQTPGPGSCIAPYPSRWTGTSPPMEKVSLGATVVMDLPGRSVHPGARCRRGSVAASTKTGDRLPTRTRMWRSAQAWGGLMGELVVVRQGQTEWSRSGQHTGVTDLPLLPEGEEQARNLRKSLAGRGFVEVWVSPRQRARRTAELAGLTPTRVDEDLVEVDYGAYEGRTTAEISEALGHPWSVWKDG